MNSEEIKKSAKRIRIDRAAIDHARILADAEAALKQSARQRAAAIQPSIWRAIMRSPITKLGSAAGIIIAAIVGIMHFGTSIDGTTVVWAEAIKNMEQVNSATMREKRIFTCDGKEVPFLSSSDAVRYYCAEFGAREDMYNTEGLLLHQVFWLTQANVRVKVVPPMERYERTELTEAERAIWGQPGFRAVVELLKGEKPTQLGRKKISSRETEGFEIRNSGIMSVIPIQIDSGVARFWIDVETSLPVRYEAELVTSDRNITSLTNGRPVQIEATGYELQWNKQIEPNIFEPNIPAEYRVLEFDASGAFPPQDVEDIVEDIGKWVRENLGPFEFIRKSRRGTSIVLRKQFLADIAVFKLQGESEDLKDFHEKLDIHFLGAPTASLAWYEILSPTKAEHTVKYLFEYSESNEAFALVAQPSLMLSNGYNHLIGVNGVGSAVVRTIHNENERHIDLSFSFFSAEKESDETPGTKRAKVDIPSIEIAPGEAVLIKYTDIALPRGEDGTHSRILILIRMAPE